MVIDKFIQVNLKRYLRCVAGAQCRAARAVHINGVMHHTEMHITRSSMIFASAPMASDHSPRNNAFAETIFEQLAVSPPEISIHETVEEASND